MEVLLEAGVKLGLGVSGGLGGWFVRNTRLDVGWVRASISPSYSCMQDIHGMMLDIGITSVERNSKSLKSALPRVLGDRGYLRPGAVA